MYNGKGKSNDEQQDPAEHKHNKTLMGATPRHWTRHEGHNAGAEDRHRLANELTGPTMTMDPKSRGLVFPRGRAKTHPAGDLLREYARVGCPVAIGENWTTEQMHAAVERGPHASSRVPDAIAQIQVEAREKEKQGFATLVKWNDIKDNPPENLKISPLAMIPHKSRKFRAILDLSFRLEMIGCDLPAVNEATEYTAMEAAIDQLGSVFPRIVEALATAPENGKPILFSKMDIKDGFWRMVCAAGEEWNFAYVLPTEPGGEVILVVPSALQMGWTLSPPFFHSASETARDVASTFAAEAVGALPAHPLEGLTISEVIGLKSPSKWDVEQALKCMAKGDDAPFLHLIEIYVDDFVAMTQTSSPDKLLHLSRAMLHGIHSVFPPPDVSGHNGQDPVSQKKLDDGDGQWASRKEILGWIFDGVTRCIELTTERQKTIDTEIKRVLRMKGGAPYKRVEKLIGKLRHATIGVPAGKMFFTPINQILRDKPTTIQWGRYREAESAFRDLRTILKAAHAEPTHVSELVPDAPDYTGWVDASGEGVGGGWLPGKVALKPTIWRFQWPQRITARLVSSTNKSGDLDINDLEMAGKVLAWLVLEGLVPNLKHAHVGIFSDNMAAVSWTKRGASRSSNVAGRLLRILGLRQRVNRSSPIVTEHLPGILNVLGDIPSRSYGNKKKWKCKHDADLLTLFHSLLPLPNQQCWRGYQLASAITSRVISELETPRSTMDAWTRLPKRGKSIGADGKHTATLSELTRTWSTQAFATECAQQQASLGEYERAALGVARSSELAASARHSAASTRRSPWTQGTSLCTKRAKVTNTSSPSSTC